MDEYRVELIEMIRTLKGVSEVDESLDLIESGFLDSFDVITLIARIEESFDIRIPGADIVPENLNKYDDIVSLIKRIKNV